MNKRSALILFVLLAIAAACAAVLLLRPGGEARPVARVTLDGELLEEIDLASVEKAFSFTVETGSGGHNTVLVEPGRISVSEADCPDQICVRQGAVSGGTVPIVCLPHKLMIEIVGGGDSLDAAAG